MFDSGNHGGGFALAWGLIWTSFNTADSFPCVEFAEEECLFFGNLEMAFGSSNFFPSLFLCDSGK